MPSSNLSRNTSGTGTSNQKFTMSLWIKKSSTDSAVRRLIELYNASTYYVSFRFRDDSSSRLDFYSESNGAGVNLRTNRSFRDLSAWYHIVLSVDTTLATADDRMKMYVNGVQETSFALRTNPSLNENLNFNNSGNGQYIARAVGTETDRMFDGSMTHIHFIDGTAYDASTFGETDSTTGIWKPKTAPSVTYGTNGFFLKGENSGALGTDSSGNANNFTVNGTPTQTISSPSNVFATMNPLVKSGSPTYANGNTTVATIGDNDSVVSTFGVSNMKYYYEAKLLQTYDGSGGGIDIGGLREEQFNASGFNSGTWSGFNNAYTKFYGNGNDGKLKQGPGNVVTTGLTRAVAGDIVMIAIDPANNRVYAGINGTWLNSSDPVAGTGYIGGTQATGTGNWFAFISSDIDKGNCNVNFGNGFFGTTAVASAQNPDDGIGIFEYDVPAGYRALCTKSINAQEYS